MEHTYRGVKITTSQNELTGKWGASYALPIDNGDVTYTECWASNEETILWSVKNTILFQEKIVAGEPPFNFPE